MELVNKIKTKTGRLISAAFNAVAQTGSTPPVAGSAPTDEIKALAAENFFHKDYEATLVDTYGLDYEDSLVLEGGGAV